MSAILNQLQALIVEKYGIDAAELLPTRSLAEFGLDSLSQVELLFTIEEEFGIEIPEERAHVNTLAELAQVVEEIVAVKAG